MGVPARSTRLMSLPDAASLEAPSLAELRALVGVLVAEVRSLRAEAEVQQATTTVLARTNESAFWYA